MALGEFNFGDLYNSFEQDKTSRIFAMVILVFLIIFGTITMINLFIAVTISDLRELKAEGFTQNLTNMAQCSCSILVEDMLPAFLLRKMRVRD